jgi:hypothetical protein
MSPSPVAGEDTGATEGVTQASRLQVSLTLPRLTRSLRMWFSFSSRHNAGWRRAQLCDLPQSGFSSDAMGNNTSKRSCSAGLALKPCGLSSGTGIFRAANKII